jgi:hypothetical protein
LIGKEIIDFQIESKDSEMYAIMTFFLLGVAGFKGVI